MLTNSLYSETIFTRASSEDVDEILSLQKVSFISEAELYDNFNIEPLTQTFESISEDFKEYTFLKVITPGIHLVKMIKTIS
jgi:hypothetical protein